MSELVYPPVIAAAKVLFRVLDLRIRLDGDGHVPRRGGAVLASNHVSYLDFIFCGLAARPAGRLVRFMAKTEIFQHKIGGPLMRGMRHIPVDRAAGSSSYHAAVARLRDGEIVGVFPEATISRSFTVKALKTGAARMAAEARVPVVPVAIWGSQRLWTKGRPRTLTRRHTPVSILVGEPLYPAPDSGNEATARLRDALSALLDQAQREYPDAPECPADAWWQPSHLGGTAPTPHEAAGDDRAGRS